MFKRLAVVLMVPLVTLGLVGCTSSSDEDKPEPQRTDLVAPEETLEGLDVWELDTSNIDLSEIEKTFPDASVDALLPNALGLLALSHIGGTELHFADWTEEDQERRFEEIRPYVTPKLWGEIKGVFEEEEDLPGAESILFPVLPHVPQSGVVTDYDLVELHTMKDEPIAFALDKTSLEVSVTDAGEGRIGKTVSVAFSLLTIIETKEGELISFENPIVYEMVPVEDTWLLGNAQWFGDPGHVIPDSDKVDPDDLDELEENEDEELVVPAK